MTPKSHCPEPIRLQALLAGRPDDQDPEHAELVRHLDGCEPCQVALTRLAEGGESFAGKARQLADENPHERTILRDLVARFRSKLDENTATIEDDLRLDFLGPASRPGLLGTLAHYEVIEVLGQGGMGIVFKALDPALNRYVAVKVMAPQLAVVAAARKRFAREARAAAALSHEHVVAIYAVDEHRGLPYLVMPLVVGESLQARLDRLGPLDLSQILRIGMQIASGLAAAHTQGLIHRDIKPANILLENGVERVKITDFGLARTVDDASLTESGILIGSPQYMAPEQARGEPLDHRADLFSLGGVMYAMCLGRSPFRAPTALAVLKRVCEDAPRPLREVNPEVPDWLAAIIDKLLEKAPEARYQTAAEVASVLEKRLAEHQLPTKTPAALLAESPPALPRRRNRWATAAMIALAVLAALGWTEATALTHVGEMLATILRIKTPEGTLIVQVDDPTADVRLDGHELVISGAGVHEVRLRPGPHQLEVTRDGKPVREELITITRGGKQVAKIEREPIADDTLAVPRYQSDPQSVVSEGPRPQAQMYRPDLPTLDPPTVGPQTKMGRRKPYDVPAPGTPAAVQLARPGETAVVATGPSGISQPDWNRADPKPNVPRPLFTLDSETAWKTTAVAHAPDGKILAMASQAVIQIWDLNSKTRLATVINDPNTGDGTNTVRSLAFSANGKSLAAGSLNGSVTLFDMSTSQGPKLTHRLTGHVGKDQDASWPDYAVWKVAFSPDGLWLASASWDNTARIWNVQTGEPIARLTNPGKVRTLAFSPEGRYLATGQGFEPGKNVWLWRMVDEKAGIDTPEPFAFSHAFSQAAWFDGNTNGTVCMAFSPDGTILATGGQDNLVRLWDVDHHSVGDNKQRTELARLSGHNQLVEEVAFSPDGKWLVSVSGNYRTPKQSGEIRIWDIEGTSTSAVQTLLPETGPMTGLSFAPDGKTFATSGGDGSIHVWAFEPSAANGHRTSQALWPRVAIRPKIGEAVTSLASSSDGKLIAAGGYGAVYLYETGDRRFERNTIETTRAKQRVVSQKGNPLPELYGLESWIMRVAFSPDGKLVASSSAKGTNRVWETETGKEIAHRDRPYVTTFPIAFTRDGRELLVTWRDSDVQSWNFRTGEMKEFSAQYRAGGLEFSSPRGGMLALFGEGDPGGAVMVLDAENHALLSSLSQSEVQAEVTCLRFVPGSKTLVVAYRRRLKDGTSGQNGHHAAREAPEIYYLNIWDAETDSLRETINWNQPILDIAISPDGNHLAVVGGKLGGRDSDKNKAALLNNWASSRPGGKQTVCFLEGHNDIVRAVAFSDGGRQVVTACDDGIIRFWKVPGAK